MDRREHNPDFEPFQVSSWLSPPAALTSPSSLCCACVAPRLPSMSSAALCPTVIFFPEDDSTRMLLSLLPAVRCTPVARKREKVLGDLSLRWEENEHFQQWVLGPMCQELHYMCRSWESRDREDTNMTSGSAQSDRKDRRCAEQLSLMGKSYKGCKNQETLLLVKRVAFGVLEGISSFLLGQVQAPHFYNVHKHIFLQLIERLH